MSDDDKAKIVMERIAGLWGAKVPPEMRGEYQTLVRGAFAPSEERQKFLDRKAEVERKARERL